MKIKNIFFLICFLALSVASCRSQKDNINIIKFSKEKTRIIRPEKNMKFYPLSYKEKKGSIFITLYDGDNHQLVTYDFNTGKIEEKISINFFKFQHLMKFNYYNKDSIFLAFSFATSSLTNGSNQDSTCMLINNKGIIKNILNFTGLPVRTSYNPVLAYESTVLIPIPFSDIFYYDNKLFFGTMKLYHSSGDSLCEANNLPLAGHYDFTTNKAILYEKINKFPFFKKDRFYNRLYLMPQFSFSDDNFPLISFYHTPIVYKYDYNKKTKKQYKIKSELVDTIKPYKVSIDKTTEIYKHSYGVIYYDKYRKLYYRFVTLAAKKDDTPFRKNHRKISMLVADTNFNKIAEGILPDNLSKLSLIITKEGLWFYNSKNKEDITFDLYNLNFVKGSKKELVKKYSEKTKDNNQTGILSFMTNLFKVEEENAAIIIVPSDLGCHSCVSTISKFYVDNQGLFKDKKLYFVVAGLAKYTVDPFIQQNGIEKGMPNLYIDKKGEYLNYLEGFSNPKLFILENGKIKFEKVYKPLELIELEIKIKEYSER